MGKSAIAKIGGGSPAREVKQKLKVDEYVLEINNEDIGKAEVTYSFDKIECTKYEAGQKSEVTYEDVIFIDVFGKNKEGLDAGFSFLVTMGLDSLNQYPKEPSNISKYIDEGEAFLKLPNENPSFLHLDFEKNEFNDIYKNLASFWISKMATNVFMFKVCVPYDNVFSYFKVDFNKEDKCV